MTTLSFNSSKELTIGVEIELQVLDQQSLLLTPRASEVIEAANHSAFKQEIFQSTLELVSRVGENVHDVEKDLEQAVRHALLTCQSLGLKLNASGTHPLADYRDRLFNHSGRYHELVDRNQWLIRRMAVYGMHVHIGMPSGDDCIETSNFLTYFVPHLIALSASSPFWQGMNTGLFSCRPTMYESLPTAGTSYRVNDWNEFVKMYDVLLVSKSIRSYKDLWWDIRPSPELGTLEVRCCDQPATLTESLALAALVHLLVMWFRKNKKYWTARVKNIPSWFDRENKWRAIRYGTAAPILVDAQGTLRTIAEELMDWLVELQHTIDVHGYGPHASVVMSMLKFGTTAQRQVACYTQSGELHHVVANNQAEFEANAPDFFSSWNVNQRHP